MAGHPIVFMSHASEDKDRFVVPFATELRTRGLAVWLDQWEMLAGDSLVKKIFTEGLDRADAVVVVVSSVSVTKKWVAEELDAAVVQRIEKDTKLIPVVLDGLAMTDLPPAIRHLLHVAVPDTGDRAHAIEKILRSIVGAAEKPPLGSLPSYASTQAASIAGLDRVDSLVLQSIGAEAVRDFGNRFRTVEFLVSVTAVLGVSEDQVVESLQVLDADGYIKLHRTLGKGVESMSSFELKWLGLQTYAESFIDDFDSIVTAIVAALANWETTKALIAMSPSTQEHLECSCFIFWKRSKSGVCFTSQSRGDRALTSSGSHRSSGGSCRSARCPRNRPVSDRRQGDRRSQRR